MKTLEEYMKLNYRLEFEPDEDEGGYVAYFPELPGCITMGDTIEEAAAMQSMLSVHGWKPLWKMKWKFLCRRKRTNIPVSLNYVCPRLYISC